MIALRQVGCQILDLSRIGQGCPDILVCWRGDLYLLEIKTRTGRLRDAQVRFAAYWPVKVVRTVQEAYRAIGLGGIA